MNIDPQVPKVMLYGIEVAAGDRIEDLRLLLPEEFKHPRMANAGYEVYDLQDDEMGASLTFKDGQIYQISVSLTLPDDTTAPPFSQELANLRGPFHDKELRRMIGTDKFEGPDGFRVGNYFDYQNIDYSIVVTFFPRDLPAD